MGDDDATLRFDNLPYGPEMTLSLTIRTVDDPAKKDVAPDKRPDNVAYLCESGKFSLTRGKTTVVENACVMEKGPAAGEGARRMEEAFKGSLDRPFAGKFLKDAGEARSYGETEPVVIESFAVDQILPALLPLYRKSGVGTLTLRNRGAAAAAEAKVEFSVSDAVTGTVAIGSIAAGETKKVPVAFNILPDTAQKRYAQMKAAARYVAGEVHQRSDAYAPLLILDKDAIDWAEPKTLTADLKDAAKYPVASALIAWLTGKRDEAMKGLERLCEQGTEEACYDLAALLFFEQKGAVADGAAIYENMLAQLPSNIIDMMIDSGGFGLADEATDEAKLKRKLRETLEAARKKHEEKKKTKNLDMIIKHVAGRKGDDLTGKPELFLLLFWDSAR